MHLSVLLSNNWYQRYSNAIFINWPTWTPRNWKRRRLWTKIETKETILIFPMWIFHINVATFLQHLRMEYISKFIRYSRAYDYIVIYLIERFRWQVTAPRVTKKKSEVILSKAWWFTWASQNRFPSIGPIIHFNNRG